MQKYHMRRQDREITDQNEIREIITQGKFAVIALCFENEPYIVTLSYGYDQEKNVLYFHASSIGLKLEFIRKNPKVCVTIIDDQGYIMDECEHAYRTIVINGEIHIVEQLEEKKHGLNVMLNHLENKPEMMKEKVIKSDEAYKNVAVLKLDILSISGKKGR